MRKLADRTYIYMGRHIYKGPKEYVNCYFSINEDDGSLAISWTQKDMMRTIRTGEPATPRCWSNYMPSNYSDWMGMVPMKGQVAINVQ